MSSPLVVSKRPFAVEPITGIMLPDGIFDTSIRRLLISAYLRNDSPDKIVRFWARIPDTADYTVTASREISVDAEIASGAIVLLQWEVTFRGAKPGKKLLNIESGGHSITSSGENRYWDGYSEATYFLSSTSYDQVSREYVCEVPEGQLTMIFHNSMQAPPLFLEGLEEGPVPAIQFPQQFTAMVAPNSLAIPFNDPWWKVVAWVVAALAGIGAIIAARQGRGAAEIGVSGHGHDNPMDYDWCVPDPTGLSPDNYLTPAGALSALANAAILVGLADDADPWERGREQANLQIGELPVFESLKVSLTYPNEMQAGFPFKVGAHWVYESTFNSGRQSVYEVDETQTNSHLADWEIEAPSYVFENQPITVSLRGKKQNGQIFKPDELYGFALFIAPDGRHSFRIPLHDDGTQHDGVASDGWFSAGIVIEDLLGRSEFDPIGEWRVQFVIQDVNDATQDMPPKVAATHIGGALLMAPISAGQTNGGACTAARIVRILVKRLS